MNKNDGFKGIYKCSIDDTMIIHPQVVASNSQQYQDVLKQSKLIQVPISK